ncbi:MAG: hypothetical protein LQ343_000736 [Gyalolechia ehrenbergii]|nr:MAG: hypothetical protein LQ343_000736 [Gyalolechia ehrenbergii]
MRLKPTITLGRVDDRPESPSRTLLQSTNFWIILCYSVSYFVIYQYCRYAYSRDPTSFFFDPKKGFQKIYSLKREQQADAFIEVANRSIDAPSSQLNAEVCLGVATIARSKDQYIRRAVGSLLEGLTDAQRASIHLAVFFAQTDPHQHPIYNEPWLKSVANEIVQYNVGDEEMARLHLLEETHQFWNKSMYDYEYLLKACLNTGAQWIMIVEDDVLAKEGWYSEAMRALEDIQLRTDGQVWLYLRLFYTEKLFGWNSEEWLQYLGWSILALLVTATTLVVSRSSSRRLRKHLSNVSIAIICFFCLPATILLYFMAGRVSMQPPPSGLHRMEKFGCCSQGFIFPRQIAPRAMDTVHHATNKRYYVDMTLERWANDEGLARFALIPPLLQHVGSRSSKGSRFDKGANSIWNFEFENYT